MTAVKVYTVSLGCPKNRVDTERLLGALGSAMEPAEYMEEAQLVLINTCGFIEPAIQESLDSVMEAVQVAEECKPRPLLAVAGCLVSRFGQALEQEIPEVDLWLSTHQLDQWPGMAAEALGRKGFGNPVDRVLSTGEGYAYLKVGEGCSHKCRFCTIPSIRGPHVSRSVEELVGEARSILAQNVPEIVVVGQDVTAYGADLGMQDGLRTLLDALLPLEGLERLRLMYLYPAGLTDGLLSYLAAAGDPFVPYFDVPLQHAHPDVLKNMGRPFARDPNLVIERIRRHFPEAALRTSLIVGYPGETEEHFETLLEFVERSRFMQLGVFPYHAEDGTPAAQMPDQIPDEVKQYRRDRVMELQAAISEDILEKYVGREVEVLVEEPHEEWPGLFLGRTWFQAPEVDGVTYVSADPDSGLVLEPGMIVTAEVVEAKTYDLVTLA